MDNKNNGSILSFIEKFGNKLPNPTMLFVYLSVITILLSFALERLGVGVSYQAIKDGQISQLSANVVNLLSADSIRTFVSSVLKNFTGFYPLGVVFAIILGIGVADKAGFLSALVKKIALKSSKKWVTPIVIFLGVMSNVASSVGYVVLIPLGAILFAGFGRHPIAGLAAAFAGASLGYGLAQILGDFVVWKKDDMPAYNLASLVDDEILGVNLLVRGEDLLSCSAAQKYEAQILGYDFAGANFIHHGLLVQGGKKLSKSSRAPAVSVTDGAKIHYKFAALKLGLDASKCDSLSNLLELFKGKFGR